MMLRNFLRKYWKKAGDKASDIIFEKDYFSIEVGKPSPFNPCLNPNGGVTASVQSGVITCVINLPNVSEYERNTLANICIAMGFYRESSFPSGVMTFVFKGYGDDDSAWPIKTPLIDDPLNVLNWVEKSESNAIMFVLVEQETNIVQQIRVLGLPKDYLSTLRDNWRNYKEFTHHEYNSVVSRFTERELWLQSKTWQYDPKTEEFVTRV